MSMLGNMYVGEGTGFFVRDDGVLVTHHRVIEGAEALAARLPGGRLVPATLLGESAAAEIAVLQAEVPGKVSFLKFADASTVKIGDCAIAVGAPRRVPPQEKPSRWTRPKNAPQKLSNTMVAGMVSSKGRSLGVQFGVFDQQDAKVAAGDTGGPLLNLAGEVIGVNDWGDFLGSRPARVGFAIDGNLVLRALGELLRKGLKARPSFGATIEERLDGQAGVRVTAVRRGSPAEQAGLKTDDVILRLGETKVPAPLQFQAVQLSDCRPGAAELEMLCDKSEQNKTNTDNFRQYMTIRVGAVEKWRNAQKSPRAKAKMVQGCICLKAPCLRKKAVSGPYWAFWRFPKAVPRTVSG